MEINNLFTAITFFIVTSFEIKGINETGQHGFKDI